MLCVEHLHRLIHQTGRVARKLTIRPLHSFVRITTLTPDNITISKDHYFRPEVTFTLRLSASLQ